MKTKLSLLSLAVCAAFSSAAFAQSGTINFTGTIQSSTCVAEISGGGGANGIVNLGTALPSAVANTGDVANHTLIAIQLDSSCVGDNFWVYFSGGNVNAAGRLNSANPNQTAINIQLTNGTSSNPITVHQGGSYNATLQGLAPSPTQGLSWSVSDGLAGVNNAYGAQFYSTTSTPQDKVGSVAGTSVGYNIIYF